MTDPCLHQTPPLQTEGERRWLKVRFEDGRIAVFSPGDKLVLELASDVKSDSGNAHGRIEHKVEIEFL